MNFLIDLLHPTEFHFFKPIISELQALGHEVILTARREEILVSLLDNSSLNYTVISTKKGNFFNLLFELMSRTIKLFKISRKSKIDVFLGMSTLSTSIIGKLQKKPIILFTECEDMGLKTKFVFRFTSRIISPKFFVKELGEKHTRFNGLLQLNYLHPDYFQPNKELVQEILDIDLNKDKYFILRFCDWKATHDFKQSGFSKEMKIKIIEKLSKHGKVYILDEKKEKDFQKYRIDFPKHKMLHMLAFSSLTITETTSVSIESALLGTPVVRCTSLVNTRMGGVAIFDELYKEGLIYSYSSEDKAYEKIVQILDDEKSKDYYISKKNNFIKQFDSNVRKTILDLIFNESQKNQNLEIKKKG